MIRMKYLAAAAAAGILTAALAACASADDTPSSAAAGPATMEDLVRSGEEMKLNQGRIIAVTECAGCHAIGTVGTSPREDAPPLRRVLLNYNRSALEIDLMEGMRVGHADMPLFTFDPRTVDALLVYLDSIQDWGLAEAEGARRNQGGL